MSNKISLTFLCKVKRNWYTRCGKKFNFIESVLFRLPLPAEHFPQLAKATSNSCDVEKYTLVLGPLSEEYNNLPL